MTTLNDRLTVHWQDVANLALGLWLMASPWALSYMTETIPTWNALIVGVIIAAAATSALVAFHAWEEWVNVVLATWLIVSPYPFDYALNATAFWNQFTVGAIVGILALWTVWTTQETGIPAGG